MVNIFRATKPLLHGLMKLAGVTPQRVEIEPGTIMTIWVPKEAINKSNKYNKLTKPAVVLVHCFAMDGILVWFPQVLALARRYAVYVPDLLFFGDSTTGRPERSAGFQAQCLAQTLRKVGLERCALVGLSYGGMIAFKMAHMYPDLVDAMVVSSTVIELTESISAASFSRLGISRWSDALLPETMDGVKSMLTIGTHKMKWLPDFFARHFLEAMFSNRKERAELLEALVVKDKEAIVPHYSQRICLLWGDDDKIFELELARNMKEQLGDQATLQYIKNAGHLVQIERPLAYNKHLKRILASLQAPAQ